MKKKIFKLMKPREELPSNPSEAIQQICNEKVAFYSTYIRPKIGMLCRIIAIGSDEIFNFALMMKRGNSYTNIINKQ